MFRTEHAQDVTLPPRTGMRRDRTFAPRWGYDGQDTYAGRNPVTEILGSVSKTLLSLAVLALVVTGCIFAFHTFDLTAQADGAAGDYAQAKPATNATMDQDQTAELTALRSEVALLTEQSLELRAELALLAGQDGVLPKLIARLQEQRRVNAAHSNALRQLYSTTGLIGASLPASNDNAQSAETIGSRPVQVTPVASAQEEAPRRVVLIPQGDDENQTQQNTGDGDGE